MTSEKVISTCLILRDENLVKMAFFDKIYFVSRQKGMFLTK